MDCANARCVITFALANFLASKLIFLQVDTGQFVAVLETLNLENVVFGQVQTVQIDHGMQAFHFTDQVLLQHQTHHLGICLEPGHLSDAIAFEIETLQFREQVHIFNLFEALIMQVQLLIQLERSVVLAPVFLEQFKQVFASDAKGATLLLAVRFGSLRVCVTLGHAERIGVGGAV